MATVRTGQRGALLVVDVQVGVVARAWDRDRVVANVARAVQRAREASVPVIWVQHQDAELPADGPDWPWVPELVPAAATPDSAAAAECLIHKQHNSAFEGTDLEAELARLGITHIVLAGAATNWCIRATAYAALERGYDLTLLADAHTTVDAALENGDRIPASHLVRDLNTAMTWLSYPGRVNGIAPAERVSFHQPGGVRA